jgi:transmembrane sensor
MNSSEEVARTAIAQQAGVWYVANQAGELSSADSAAFLTWLKASPIHIEEYLGILRVACRMRDAVGKPQVPLEIFLAQARAEDTGITALGTPSLSKHRPALRTPFHAVWRLAAMVAAMTVLAVGALWWGQVGDLIGLPRTYQTTHGGSSERRLSDGSLLRLDTDSAVTVRYTYAERVVELIHGQAFLVVTHERRRFRVEAGEAEAIAVGTRFDVLRQADTTVITVAEGQVAVFSGKPPWLGNQAGAPDYVPRIKAGYQLRVGAGVLSAQPVSVDLEQILGWLQHKIVFRDRALSEVAAEFNRYGRIPLEIDDEMLRTLLVSGRFDAGDTDSFIQFLETLPGVTVERAPTRIRVLRMATAT